TCPDGRPAAYCLHRDAAAANRAPLLGHRAAIRTLTATPMGMPIRLQEFVMAYRVAVVGATGAVGREMLKTLAERNFPVSEVIALASGRSAGAEVSFGDRKTLTVQSLEKFDFKGTDFGLF